MEQSKISFESLPELVSSLASEIEGLKTLVKEALGNKTSEPDNRLVGIDESYKPLRRKKSTIYHMVCDGILPHYKVGKMPLETRLKSIDEKLGNGFCLLVINCYDQKRDKGHSSILNVLKNLKYIEFEGCLPFIAFLALGLLSTFVISSIKVISPYFYSSLKTHHS